jgi:hypothetical protein
MHDRRYVFIDPDGTQGREWLYVIVRAPTGVFYEQQYGGTATLLNHVEGYLVPVKGDQALAELRAIFERDLRGSGAGGHSWPDGLLLRLRNAVGKVAFWDSPHTSEGLDFSTPQALEVDGKYLRELDEAWIPVITPDGPGVLIWANSD